MINIFVVRHGETDLNKENRLRSWKDVPLNAEGLKQARQLAWSLRNEKIKCIYSSDLKRSLKTAMEIKDLTGADLETPTSALRSVNYGDLSGKKLKDISLELSQIQKGWQDDPDKKCPGGESYTDFQDRMVTVFEKILSEAKEGENLVIATHLRNCVWILEYLKNKRDLLEGDQLKFLNKGLPESQMGQVFVLKYDKRQDKCTFQDGHEISKVQGLMKGS